MCWAMCCHEVGTSPPCTRLPQFELPLNSNSSNEGLFTVKSSSEALQTILKKSCLNMLSMSLERPDPAAAAEHSKKLGLLSLCSSWVTFS
ncbi:hypothetical protein TWF192_004703 [Orbilia oligospora]|uniref:Uncharacterized protein n=1 Tax=Orbilia oligospora TaxID=2813651 RepID=A0A6G1MAA5_ORBOL|nr:hypothetical protein TWF679_009920 [Orbilia oligospora]KAF3251743.1 hypothetical protein TWF192_004703 [Orbilia oligospora]